MTSGTLPALTSFIEKWQETPEKNKSVFLHLKSSLERKSGVNLDFQTRHGVTYSLRAAHTAQKDKGLFVMVDVIEDDPRWLSVCFYGDMISDPDERGDFVPDGLLGEDAVCFDIEGWDDELVAYVECRIDEAWSSASQAS